MKKKRIFLVLTGPVFDIADWLREMLEQLSEEYEGICFLTMREPKEIRIGSIVIKGIRVRKKLPRFMGHLKFFAVGIGMMLRDRIRGKRWDLIVSYDPLKTGLLASWLAGIQGAKFICEVNGVYHSPNNYIDDPSRLRARMKLFLYPLLMRYVLGKAAGVKVLYPTQVDPFLPYMRNPIIVTLFAPVSFEHHRFIEERKEVLFAGFPFKRKGVDILIAAFKKVAPAFPDWKLKILGWFPDKAQLEEHMAGHPQIYHHPPVFNNDMPDHMGRCGILVLPSRSEGMGRVLLEAMAAEKPRIGARVEGIPTVIEDGVDGFLFEPGNADDLAGKLQALMESESLRRKFGENGRRRLEKDFNTGVFFDGLKTFYRDVVRR